MIITSFRADGFRNLKNVDISLHPRLNILCGKNAQGKTNILEAVWLCSGEKSFRGAREKELCGVDRDMYSISLDFKDRRRKQSIEIASSGGEIKNRKVSLNGVTLKNPAALFGELQCVVFTPEDLGLSKGPPDSRRRFADLSISQLKGSYRAVTEKYRRLNEQRSFQLKAAALGKSDSALLDVWDIQLSQMGAYITMLRYNYCKKLSYVSSILYKEISGGAEELAIKYDSTVFENLEGRNDYKGDLAAEYLEKLKANRSEDIRMGHTQIGVHRDDINIYIGGLAAKDYASQGQHRSAALVLKLAQAYILSEETLDPPCILLDDVLSELDSARQSFVMNKIRDMQVIITCCDEELFYKNNKDSRLFKISSGRIV